MFFHCAFQLISNCSWVILIWLKNNTKNTVNLQNKTQSKHDNIIKNMFFYMSYLFLQINSSYLCGNQDTFNIIHVFTITFDQLNASLMNMINRNCLKNIQYVYLYTYFNFDGFVLFSYYPGLHLAWLFQWIQELLHFLYFKLKLNVHRVMCLFL